MSVCYYRSISELLAFYYLQTYDMGVAIVVVNNRLVMLITDGLNRVKHLSVESFSIHPPFTVYDMNVNWPSSIFKNVL